MKTDAEHVNDATRKVASANAPAMFAIFRFRNPSLV
jgi:hypothetical protein